MYSKTKIVLIASVVLLSMGFTSSFASATATGSVNYSPVVFSQGGVTLTSATGGNFVAGSTVYFYVSSGPSSSDIIGGYVASYLLPQGSSSLSNSHFQVSIPSTMSAGSYYIIASDSSSPTSSSAQFTTASPITVSLLKPTMSVTPSSGQPTASATVSGSGWDPSSTVSVYIAGPQGSPLFSTLLTTLTVTSSGVIKQGTTFTIPEIAENSYSVVAEESSSSSPNYGITADSSLSVTPILVASPYDISGASGSQFSISGYGFPSLATITSNGVTVGTVKADNSATTASTSGSFSITATMTGAITTAGAYNVIVQYNTTQFTQSNGIFVSIPNSLSLGFTFSTASTVYPGSSYKAEVYNFPAGSQVSLTLGPITLGQISTDSNGFGQLQGSIPALPAGTYEVSASSNGLYSSTTVTIQSYFQVLDPDGVPMTSTLEFFPEDGYYQVQAYGLNPLVTYTYNDSAVSSSYEVSSVSAGTLVSRNLLTFNPSANGTLIFTFYPHFISSTSTSSITLKYTGGSVGGYSGNTYGYTAIKTPYFSVSHPTVSIMEAAASQTITVYNILPQGSQVYPGLQTYYNLYMGSTELSFTEGTSSQTTDVLSSTINSPSVTFTAPSAAGIYYLGITYAGGQVASEIYSAPVVVSYQATALDSGTVQAIPIYGTNGQVTSYDFVGYSFYPGTMKLYYYTQGSLSSTTPGLQYGAFVYSPNLPAEPAGTYRIIAQDTYSSSTYTTNSSYTIYPYFSTTTSSGTMDSTVTFSMSGFAANTFYTIYFGSDKVYSGQTSSAGSISSQTFTTPVVLPGTYNISVVQDSTLSAVASQEFTIMPSQTLNIPGGSYAFPGQIVSYSWKPSSAPQVPGSSSGSYGNIYVTVYLNGSAFYTSMVPLTNTYLNGSFSMPNSLPGNYWNVTLSWSQNEYTPTGSPATSTVVTTNFHKMSQGNGVFLQLVSGNGALITGISSTQIAQITSQITSSTNSTISAALSVPLSQLDATVSSINGSLASIKTSFGTMQASLTTLNANIASVNGTLVTLNTSIGTVTTSLSSINATVTSVKSGVGTVQTSIGTLTGAVTSISGNAVTIQTSVGTLKADLNSVNSKLDNVTNYGMIFDIVIIALIAVTLGLAVAGLLSTRDMKKRFGMKKE